MANFQKLLQDTEAIGSWLQQQQPDLEHETFLNVKKTQAQQIIQEIQAFSALTPSQAKELGETLRNGPWQAEDKALFAGAMSTTLASKGGNTISHKRRKNQEVLTFHAFFSQKDVQVLQDPNETIHTKADQVATRLVRVQLWLASEKGYKSVVQAAMAAGLELPSAKDKIFFLDKLKSMVKAKTKSFPVSISVPTPFPTSPERLPVEVRQQAYSADDPPTTLDEAACMTKDMICRKSSLTFREDSTALVPVAKKSRASRSSMGSQPDEQQEGLAQIGQAFMEFCGNYMQGGNSGGGSAASSSDGAPFLKNFQILKPKNKIQKPKKEGELHVTTPAEDPAEKKPGVVDPKDGGLQLFTAPPSLSTRNENDLLNAQKAAATMEDAVQKRKDLAEDLDLDAAESHEAMKKPASKNVVKTIGKPMKKPAQAPVAGKWKVEVRTRKAGSSKGQTDTYYHAPNGRVYRILGDAVRAGYRA